MATSVRKIDTNLIQSCIAQLQALRLDIAKLKLGTLFHIDQTAADVSPTAVDLPTTIVMANNLKAEFNTHIASACSATTGQGVHVTADASNAVATANATDLTSVEALLNAIKTAFNAHLTQSSVHHTNDSTNTVSTTNAVDLATSEALANALQTKINAHFAAGFTHQAIQQVSA